MTTNRPREWDAATYDSLPLPHQRWGRGVLDSLPLHGDERVLDVGAGTGRDTAALLERLPRGHVVAVDGSLAMLAQLRSRLTGVGPDRLMTLHADLTAMLTLEEPVDAVFSVATLHWFPTTDSSSGHWSACCGPAACFELSGAAPAMLPTSRPCWSTLDYRESARHAISPPRSRPPSGWPR
ncbi:MAG: class I SAM-dependent methyltransferase, partial [Actinobacteria bacterium]|nr:class I SAM-dependent methyltransferase [Actinomycetota bacterium]